MTKLIEERWASTDGLREIEHDDLGGLQRLLLGYRVAKIADDHLELDDGTVVRVVPNEGRGGCSSGNYHLSDLNEIDNVITAVTITSRNVSPDAEDWDEVSLAYEVFVVAGDKRINLFTVEGDDGNGYYGTGYVILVREAR